MKSSFKMALLAPALFAYLFLIVVHMSSCKGGPAVQRPPVAILYLIDSSGPQPILHTSAVFPSSTTVQGICNTCKDSSGNTGSGKVVFSATLNMDIPANTDIILHVVSK